MSPVSDDLNKKQQWCQYCTYSRSSPYSSRLYKYSLPQPGARILQVHCSNVLGGPKWVLEQSTRFLNVSLAISVYIVALYQSVTEYWFSASSEAHCFGNYCYWHCSSKWIDLVSIGHYIDISCSLILMRTEYCHTALSMDFPEHSLYAECFLIADTDRFPTRGRDW